MPQTIRYDNIASLADLENMLEPLYQPQETSFEIINIDDNNVF